MLTFILVLFLAIIFGYFATQNSQSTAISLSGYRFPSVPLYIVIGITLLLGLGFSWVIGLVNGLATSMKLRGKDHAIKNANQSINDLNKKINQLELENANLKGRLDKSSRDSLQDKD